MLIVVSRLRKIAGLSHILYNLALLLPGECTNVFRGSSGSSRIWVTRFKVFHVAAPAGDIIMCGAMRVCSLSEALAISIFHEDVCKFVTRSFKSDTFESCF